MSISSITPTDPTQVSALSPLTNDAARASGVDTDDPDGSGTGSSSVSPMAKLFGQLAQLQQSDPATLKTVLGDIADKLQATAQQDGGSQGQFLSNLADKFRQASQSGDLSSLRAGGHHHHGGHHHPAAAYQQSSAVDPSATSTTDPRTQISDIIDQAISADLGGTTPTT